MEEKLPNIFFYMLYMLSFQGQTVV